MLNAELYQIAGDEDEIIKRKNLLETELGSLKAGEKILDIWAFGSMEFFRCLYQD